MIFKLIKIIKQYEILTIMECSKSRSRPSIDYFQNEELKYYLFKQWGYAFPLSVDNHFKTH